jgi:hypothetical protein
MNPRKLIPLLIALTLIAAFLGCGGSSYSTPGTPSTSLPTAIAISPSPFPTTLYVNDTLSVTALVSNDSGQGGGVIWSCTPGNSAATCGTFSSGTGADASGIPVTYTAPANPVSAVTITATAVDNSGATTSSAFAVNATVISVAFSTTSPPPASLATAGTATIAATVTGDPASLGVNWGCTPATACAASNFSPASTGSGVTTTFTAPSSPGNVTISATSISDDTQVATATIAITSSSTGPPPLAAGNYTFWLSGWDSNNTPYYVAGAFTVAPGGTASGGTISAGEQDFVDYYYVLTQDSITGSYTVTPDGNLQITLNTGDICIGPGANSTCGQTGSTSAGNGQEILNATLTSTAASTTSSARIMEFDSWASGGGQLEPQSPPATTPLAGYAFSVSGVDANNPPNPLAIGGVINVDGTSGTEDTIDGVGSILDENDGGSLTPSQTFTASTVDATPSTDGFGRVTFTLNTSALGSPGIVLVG